MKFAKVRNVKSPSGGTPKSAGIDFYVPDDFKNILLTPGDDILIPSGIRINIPEGYMLMGADKSGIAASEHAKIRVGQAKSHSSYDTCLIVGAKIIDQDYQGELHIHLINVGADNYLIKPGQKIAQFILVPILYADLEEVCEDELFGESSERGDGGFGSTGNK